MTTPPFGLQWHQIGGKIRINNRSIFSAQDKKQNAHHKTYTLALSYIYASASAACARFS